MTDWIAVLKTAAEVAAATTTLVGFGGQIYRWFENLLEHSGDKQARRTWEEFKRDPHAYKNDLAEVAADLRPHEDPALEGYLLGLAAENLRTDATRIYLLLSGPRYTFDQVRDICARIDPTLTGLNTHFSKQDAARWVVNLSMTRASIRNELVKYMLEFNTDVISDIVLWE